MRYIITALAILCCIVSTLHADTILKKDRREIKGLVVEEYVDRITLSTVDGEENIFRKDIDRIEYDTPEQNFMQLGRAYDLKGWYDRAASYYKKAMDVNPDYKEAREAYIASQAKMWRQEERMTRRELERRRMVMDWQEKGLEKDLSSQRDEAELLKDVLGISLVEKDGSFTIDGLRSDSSAARAGIQKGDIVVGIWDKFVSYSRQEDVTDELLGPKYSEVRLVIEREISVPVKDTKQNLYDSIGILLGFEYEGLRIKDIVTGGPGDVAGFKKGDFIVAVDKNITRYLSLDDVIALINSAKDNSAIAFTVRRTVNLRREGRL